MPFVCSSFTPELAIIDVASHQIIKRVPQVSPFSPNIAVPRKMTRYGSREDVGKTQVVRRQAHLNKRHWFEYGPITIT